MRKFRAGGSVQQVMPRWRIFVHLSVINTSNPFQLNFEMKMLNYLVIGKPYGSYVAIGDSLSEGLGDFTFHKTRRYNGWTDRLAGLMAKEANENSQEFNYANLALRGSKLEVIMDRQLTQAIELNPDLVTVMAGSNDLMSSPEKLPRLRNSYRAGVEKLMDNGIDVILVNTINPLHLNVFKPLRYRAERMSELIGDVANEYSLPVVDLFGIESFADLCYWAEDMVHFSGHGHIKLANEAASLLELKYRFKEAEPHERSTPARDVINTIRWIHKDVIPFTKRKIKGVTSGDGMDPKSKQLEPFRPITSPYWQLTNV